MALASRIHASYLYKRDTDANDTPLAVREVVYTDSNGVQTGKRNLQVRLYNNLAASAATVLNTVYQVFYTGNPATSPQVKAATTTTPPAELVVAAEVIPTATWGWFVVSGWCDCLVDGTTDVAVGDFLKLTSGTFAGAFIKDGTSYTTSSHAVAGAASTADTNNKTLVELLGGEHLVG